MPPAASALSQTLQSLTQSKIRELDKRRRSYEARRLAILEAASATQDPRQRLRHLLDGVKELYPSASTDSTMANIERWIHQSSYDSSIPPTKLGEFETQLLTRLNAQSRKLDLADLYSRLLTEWVDPPVSGQEGPDMAIDDDYMVVDGRQKQRLQQLCDQFDASVFEPLETSEEQIQTFLDQLFPDEESMKALDELRKQVRDYTLSFWREEEPFSSGSVADCVRGLLNEDLLSEQKRAIMKSFLKTPVALTEIADVLNMRYGDLENWAWHAGEEGIPVVPRQQANGKYRIWMDEDLLQLIFVQYIGTRLCNRLKMLLTSFIRQESVWNWRPGVQPTARDRLRRIYYMAYDSPHATVEASRKEDYLQKYFLSQLPTSETTLSEKANSYDDHDEDTEGRPTGPKTKNFRQLLLRKIATEALLHRHMHGAAAVVQSDMKWYATCLPHSTIVAVMKYIGFPQEWIDFYYRYLEAPLNMDSSCEGREPIGPRIRKRGIPFSHASEKLLGELILFFMDLAVNRNTGMLLYRLHDDLWLCGDPAQCVRAWEVMNKFAEVTGLEFNHSKTGSAYLAESRDPSIAARLPTGAVTFGFLKLDADSETWVIDESPVDAHVQQLRQQLDRCDSVISWVRTWNSCIGRFFKNTFGQPAYCFGEPHVRAILTTYKKTQETIFGNPETGGISIPDHLRAMITSRFGAIDIPDAFFFFPEELGGLGLRNPFVSVFLVENIMGNPPRERIERFLAEERISYAERKKEFEGFSDKRRRQMLKNCTAEADLDRPLVTEREMNTFMPFEEFVRFRECSSGRLRQLYDKLMQVPCLQGIRSTREIKSALEGNLSYEQFNGLDEEEWWNLQLYVGEVVDSLGGINLVDKKFLPVGVLGMVKEKKVKWQMVL
ncbi:hypothetical protein BO78DRAFT_328444 [Aspergillus sclerotiicarbonarius CBS 121057]|uniref:Reverse transcriptase domain-containing protein n=1 Tax=Aspergillus sclerotiicarbonarius (strain CBS 121057 / IBT 28362) TaxID=1448318 RepID=A0A319DTS0_ASPSB|nr:hypothetical protein BO78DRAFT_328444 [Aspergillus sclerotiicarbonarius CBS 121057]